MLLNNTNNIYSNITDFNENNITFFSYNHIVMSVIFFHLVIGLIIFVIYYKTRKTIKNSLHIQNVDIELVELSKTMNVQNMSTDLIIDIPQDTLITNLSIIPITPNPSISDAKLEEDFEILYKEIEDDDETISLLHENIIIQNKYKFI